MAKPEGDHQTGKYHWGSPIVKLQDEHVFGNNFYLSLKYSFNDAGFGWRPVADEGLLSPVIYDQAGAKYVPYATGDERQLGLLPRRPGRGTTTRSQATYFNDSSSACPTRSRSARNTPTRIADRVIRATSRDSGRQELQQPAARRQPGRSPDDRRDGRLAAGQRWCRDAGSASLAEQFAAYFQDTIVKGNFTLTLGLRYDKQWPGAGADDLRRDLRRRHRSGPWNKVFAATRHQHA